MITLCMSITLLSSLIATRDYPEYDIKLLIH